MSKSLVRLVSSAGVGALLVAFASSANADCVQADPGVQTAYPPAKHAQSVCTSAEIATLTTAIQNKKIDQSSYSAACGACLFSVEADATWGPIVQLSTSAVFFNGPGCYAIAPGGSTACGDSLGKQTKCVAARCPATSCTTPTDLTDCEKSVLGPDAGTSCGQYDVAGDCPNLSAESAKCDSQIHIVTTFCGGVEVDGGAGSTTDEDAGTTTEEGDDASTGDITPTGGNGVPTTSQTSKSGCAQTNAAPSGSLAGLLFLATAVFASVSRRRQKKG